LAYAVVCNGLWIDGMTFQYIRYISIQWNIATPRTIRHSNKPKINFLASFHTRVRRATASYLVFYLLVTSDVAYLCDDSSFSYS